MPESWLKRISGNKMAVSCSVILMVITFCALMAPFIVMDKSPQTNNQILSIALQSPMFRSKFLLRVKNTPPEKSEQFDLYRKISFKNLEEIPFDQLAMDGNTINITYRDQVKRFSMADVIAPINENMVSRDKPDEIFILLNSGDSIYLNRMSVINKINKDHIVSHRYFMGTDKYGRDVLSRIVMGLKISLFIGLLSVIISLFVGITIGSLGGYYGGWVDKLFMLIINTSWSIPTILLAFAIILAFGKGIPVIILAVGLTMWVDVARLVRGQVIQIKNETYIKSSEIVGFGKPYIIINHILPNAIGPILVIAAANFATAILVEAGLSYLGLGIQPPTPSLGNMLQENYAYATGGFIYLAIFPIIVIMTLVLCFNLLGTSLRDVFDVKSKET